MSDVVRDTAGNQVLTDPPPVRRDAAGNIIPPDYPVSGTPPLVRRDAVGNVIGPDYPVYAPTDPRYDARTDKTSILYDPNFNPNNEKYDGKIDPKLFDPSGADMGRINLLLDVMAKTAPTNFPTLSDIHAAAGRELQAINNQMAKAWARKVAADKVISDKRAADLAAAQNAEAARALAQAKSDQDAADRAARSVPPVRPQVPTAPPPVVQPSPAAVDRGGV